MTVTVLTFKPSPVLLRAMHDRQTGHSVVMKALPAGLTAPARESADCLWHVDPEHGTLRIHASTDVRRDAFGELVEESTVPDVEADQPWAVALAISCQYTPPSAVPEELRPILKQTGCYRSRLVTVPVDQRGAWLTRRLALHGFDVDRASLTISELHKADLGRRGGVIPYVDVTASGTVRDPELFARALLKGVGKGKNFGLGLIRLAANEENSNVAA